MNSHESDEHRISIPRVGSSNLSERAKQNQILRGNFRPICFPEKPSWEAAGNEGHPATNQAGGELPTAESGAVDLTNVIPLPRSDLLDLRATLRRAAVRAERNGHFETARKLAEEIALLESETRSGVLSTTEISG